MKVTERKLADGRIRLDAVATPEEVARALDSGAMTFAMQMGIPPVPGTSALEAIRAQYGMIDVDALVGAQAAEALTPFAIDKRGIVPAYPPKTSTIDKLQRGREYSFCVMVAPKPAYELSSYEPVAITVEPYAFNPAAVDEQLRMLAEQSADLVADDPHPVNVGDPCLLSMEISQNGKVIEGISTDGRTYIAGSGMMPEGFDKEIIGMEVGETKTFRFEAPSLDDAGKDAVEEFECTATVKEVQKRVIPAINDAWVKKNMPLYGNEANLRSAIAEELEKQYRTQYDNYCRQVATAEMAKRFKGRIADEVYEAMRETMLTSMNAELQQQGKTLESFIQESGGEQNFGMTLMMQIRENLVQGYTLDAVFTHEKLAVSDEDIEDACRAMNPQNPEMVRVQMEGTGQGFALRELAERRAASKWLVDHANITVKELS